MPPPAGRTDLFRVLVSGLVASPVAVGLVYPVAALTGLTAGWAEPNTLVTAAMLFWPVYIAIYLAWSLRSYAVLPVPALRAVARHDARGQRSWSQRLTGATGFVNTLGGAASTAVIVLFVIAGREEFRGQPFFLALGLLNVAASWALMVHLFAQSYLRLEAGAAPGTHLELAAPGPARFQDYFDVAVMVSTMGAAVPAQPRSRAAWRMLRTNTVVAFTFNSVIIAMLASLLLSSTTG